MLDKNDFMFELREKAIQMSLDAIPVGANDKTIIERANMIYDFLINPKRHENSSNDTDDSSNG